MRFTCATVLGVCAWALVLGGLRGGPCEERPGLPCAGRGGFLPALTDLPQGTGQPLSRADGASGKVYLRKRKNTTQAEEERRGKKK